MIRLRSHLLVLAVPALVAACSSAGGTSLDGYTQPSAEGETAVVGDAGTSGVTVTGTGSGSSGSGASGSSGTGGGDAGSLAPVTDAGEAADAAPAPISCPYTGTPLPTSAFASCGGEAVCAPAALIPTASQADFAACSTGLCVPTKVLAAYGNYVPATCQSLENAEGRCLNTVLPSVSGQKDQLPQATCDADERCVPCFSPLDGSSTGACTTVSCDAPTQPAKTFASCCSMGGAPQGKCVPAAMAGASASELSSDGCNAEPGDVCAPTEDLSASFVPQACKADDSVIGFFTGSYKGVCVSLCVPQDFTEGLGTGQGNCDDLHFCAPCTDPISGDPTGVPGCPAN